MSVKVPVRLGGVQETLLVPLYARALESRRKRPILVDPKAAEMVEAIDWDYRRFGQRARMAACALRTVMFDEWVKDFLGSHPDGTVVEIGSGLNTCFERVDNGRVRWFDLDLPDVVELRRRFFADSERRTMLAGSVLEPGWIAAVRQSPGPYFFVSETVLVYLAAEEVRAALTLIAGNFPGARLAFDTTNRRAVTGGNKDMVRRKMAARFAWACEDPKELESWEIGLRLVESRTMVDVPASLAPRLTWGTRATMWVFRRCLPKVTQFYRLNLFAADAPGC